MRRTVGEALARAVKKRAGEAAFIQRCELYKRRNVLSHLPDEHQPLSEQKLIAAWGMFGYEEAKKALVEDAGIPAKAEPILSGVNAAPKILVVGGCDIDCARLTMEAGGFSGFMHLRVTDLGMEKTKSRALLRAARCAPGDGGVGVAARLTH